jgi:large subunit ribosomal protein L25
MSESFAITAQSRNISGRGASRRLRKLGQVPAIVYGGQKEPTMVSLNHNELVKQLEYEAFYSHVLQLNLDGVSEPVVLKDLHRHPARPIILHADLMRADPDKKLRMLVPLHFINGEKCAGVKKGGTVTHSITEIEVTCLPRDLPAFITVDVGTLEMNQTIHIKDILWPQGVEPAHAIDPKSPVVSVHGTRAGTTDEEGTDAATTVKT